MLGLSQNFGKCPLAEFKGFNRATHLLEDGQVEVGGFASWEFDVLVVLETKVFPACQDDGEAAADVAADLSSTEENSGVIQKSAFGSFNGLKFVHEAGNLGGEHFVALGDDFYVRILCAAIAAAFVVEIVSSTERGSSCFGPVLIVVIVGATFAAEDLGNDPRHVRLEGQSNEVDHQLDVGGEFVFARIEANAGFIKLGASLFENGVLGDEPFFHFSNGLQVLLKALLVGIAKFFLEGRNISRCDIQDAAIQGQAFLSFFDLGFVCGWKKAFKNGAMGSRCRNVGSHGIAGKSCCPNTIFPGKGKRGEVGGASMLGGDLVHGDGVGQGSWGEIDIVSGQPVVGVNVSGDAALNVGKIGKYGEVLTMFFERLV